MASFTNPFSLKGLSESLEKLYKRSATGYNILGATVAIAGVLLLALIPLFALIAPFQISSAFSVSWISGLIWLAISATTLLVIFSLIRSKIAIPSGLGIKDDKAPRLHELVNELADVYGYNKIDRVVIHDHFGIDIVHVPRFGLPLLNTTVLHIGLPVLQALSPAQFKGALSRKIGQYSAKHNKLIHWIYRWRQTCAQYQKSYKKLKGWYYAPIRLFFNLYTPVLNAFTVQIARQDELEADVYSLEMINDEELADIIIRYHVCQHFMTNKYWPKIHSLYRKNPAAFTQLPHISLQKVMKNSLNENEFAQTLNDLISNETMWYSTLPGLHDRLDHLGQTKLNMPPPVMETAAFRYLGDAYSAVIKLMDKQWLAKQPKKPVDQQETGEFAQPEIKETPTKDKSASNKTKKQPAQKPAAQKPAPNSNKSSQQEAPETQASPETGMTEEARYNELREKSKTGRLSNNEAYDLASLTEKFDSRQNAIAMYQLILKQNPTHAKTIFAVGRILLTEGDMAGVKVLERAMELDKGVEAQSCWMLAKFFKAKGDDKRSRHYLERAANVSAAA